MVPGLQSLVYTYALQQLTSNRQILELALEAIESRSITSLLSFARCHDVVDENELIYSKYHDVQLCQKLQVGSADL